MEEVKGYIERITYQNPENGYTVAKIKTPQQRDLITVVGSMPSLQPGETVCFRGTWKTHLVHGRQFEVKEYHIEAPADIIGIKKYLGSGLIKGIGHTYASRIVDKFGVDTLDIIENEPEKLLQVEGLGKGRLKKLRQCWAEQKGIRDVMVFLQTYGVTPTFAQKIFKRYGNQCIKTVRENPYCLATDIWGIGFKSADKIAKEMGIDKDSPQRIDAGIEYVLSELSTDGNVCFPVQEFFDEAAPILEVDKNAIEQRLDDLKEGKRIEIHELPLAGQMSPFVWIRPLFLAEVGIARELTRIIRARSILRPIDEEKALDWVQQQLNIELAENQKAAVQRAMREKIMIITGGPGTGKSTITNAIITITEKLTTKIALAAPTGRAAKRMSEITGKKASTIHSLLEFNPAGGFKRNKDKPLECDLIIIDEASMIDTSLMYHLLKAIPRHSRVIFVGDINQLPSVGPGNVLKDLIASGHIPVTMLKEIFRQAAGSRIVINAHKINNGQFPDLRIANNSDFYFIDCEDKDQVLNHVISLVASRLPNKYGYNPLSEIQVLSPMKKGVLGTENLNSVLQETLNKNKNPLFRWGYKLLVGDKVMQIRNNYNKNVYNGDIGVVRSISHNDEIVEIEIDEKIVSYEFSELDEIVLAYAVSVHKYQGSECPCIVMPIHTTHFKLLHRNLLYTGVTRGKKLVVLVGTKKAVAIAIHNDEVRRRYTSLRYAIDTLVQGV